MVALAGIGAVFWGLASPRIALGAPEAPFTEWIQAVAGSAQALADGDDAAAAARARTALSARPEGPATQRSTLALALASGRLGSHDEAAKLLARAAPAIDPRIAADVTRALTSGGAAAQPPGSARPPGASPPSSRPAPSTAGEHLRAAEELVLDARPREALASLDAAGSGSALSPAQRDTASLLRAWAFMQLGRRDEAEERARAILASSAAEPGTRLGAELVIARVAARAGRVADAIARYDIISTRPPAPIPGLPAATARDLAVEAAYLSAWLPFDAGQWARAAEDLTNFAARSPRSPRAVDARWFAAWALFRDGRTAEARQAWASLERTTLAPGALYWQARTSRGARARALHQAAIAAEPGGWYAFLSAGRLRAMGVPASAFPRGAPAPVPEETGASAASMARAAAFLELGLRDAAIDQLRGATGNRTSAAHVAQLAEAVGAAELTLRIARDLLPLSRRALRWMHPLAYGSGLEAIASAADVDPHLFRALIRRESVFREEARSPAGAEGLAQLMPYTAERLAVVLGAPADARLELRDATSSLALGAAYLGLLSDRFVEPAAVLAAYNGGPAPALAWAESHAGRPLDECVEELPFRETRRYVKVVMAAYATYRHLHEGAPASLDGSRALPRPRGGVAF